MLILSLVDKLYEVLILIKCEDILRQFSIGQVGHNKLLSFTLFIFFEIAEERVVCHPKASHFSFFIINNWIQALLVHGWIVKHDLNNALFLYKSKKLRCILHTFLKEVTL